jgi:hypothetical protein
MLTHLLQHFCFCSVSSAAAAVAPTVADTCKSLLPLLLQLLALFPPPSQVGTPTCAAAVASVFAASDASIAEDTKSEISARACRLTILAATLPVLLLPQLLLRLLIPLQLQQMLQQQQYLQK